MEVFVDAYGKIKAKTYDKDEATERNEEQGAI